MDLQRGFRVGRWDVYPMTGEISSGEEAVHLEPKVMEVLVALADHSGQVMSRDQLTNLVWGSRAAVADEPLTRCIAQLRQALGDPARDSKYVQTVPKRGYRLLQPAEPLAEPDEELIATIARPAMPSADRRNTIRRVSLLIAVLVAVGASLAYTFLSPRLEEQGVLILSFEDLTGREELAHIPGGLSDTVDKFLSAVDSLRVEYADAAYSGAEAALDPAHAANQYGTAYVLSARVSAYGASQIRLFWQLINVADGGRDSDTTTLSVNLDNDELEGVATRICTFVVDIVLESSRAANACEDTALDSQNSYALQAFWLAKERMEDRSFPGLASAERLFNEAIEYDPTYGQAYLQLASVHALLPTYGSPFSRQFHYDRAREILAAGELRDPGVVRTGRHLIDAAIFLGQKNWPAAHRAFESAGAATSRDAELLQRYTHFLGATGRIRDALEVAHRSEGQAPNWPVVKQRIAILSTWIGDDDEAQRYFDLAAEYGYSEEANRAARAAYLMRLGRGNPSHYDEVGELLKQELQVGIQTYQWVDAFIGYFQNEVDKETAIEQLQAAAEGKSITKTLLFGAWVYLEEWDRAIEVGLSVAEGEEFNHEFMFSEDARGLQLHDDFALLLEKFGIIDYWEEFDWQNDICPRPPADGVLSCGL